MSLEADPAPTLFSDGGLATRSGDPTFRRGRCWSGSQMELSAGIGKTIRKELIEAVARKAKGGTG
jgi:hypothetical protein